MIEFYLLRSFFTLIYLISTFSQEEYRNKDKKYKEFVKKKKKRENSLQIFSQFQIKIKTATPRDFPNLNRENDES